MTVLLIASGILTGHLMYGLPKVICFNILHLLGYCIVKFPLHSLEMQNQLSLRKNLNHMSIFVDLVEKRNIYLAFLVVCIKSYVCSCVPIAN